MKVMIFLCFSSKDRYTIVESVLYHLKNYGINTWYDYHILILGDDKYQENIENGVKKSKYVVWILSPNFYDCACGQMELAAIKDLYHKGAIHIFPILYNVTADNLPAEYHWVKDLIYNELSEKTPSLPTCNQIVCKILKDEIKEKSYTELSKINSSDKFINNLVHTYFCLDERNINAKITTLYCIYTYLDSCGIDLDKMSRYVRILNQLFKQTKLNLTITFKELIIAEFAITIMLNEWDGSIENFDN